MGIMISIWGKGGSGKSTFASNLACCLAKKGKLVGILGTNTTYGSLQHYFGMQITDEKSLYRAFNSYNDDDIVKNFVSYPKLRDLFVLSLANTDDSLKIESISNEMGKNLLLNVKDSFEFLIVDCTDSKYDALTLLSLTYSDSVIEIMRPTVQGIAYHVANEKLINSLKISNKLMLVLNANRNFLDLKNVKDKVKLKPIINLPYSLNVERSENNGEPIYLSGGLIGADRRYIKEINRLADILSNNCNAKKGNPLKILLSKGVKTNAK
jgi:cellulose biosynthesis protein BcsQ